MESHLAAVRAKKLQQEQAAEAKRKKEEAKMRETLLEAAFDNELETVENCLEWGLEADCQRDGQNSPLSDAACGGAMEVVELLLRLQADPNSRGEQGRTPLFRAMFNDHIEVVEVLLKQAADPRMCRIGNDFSKEVRKLVEQWDIKMTDDLLQARAGQQHQRFLAKKKQMEEKVVSIGDELAQLELKHQQNVEAYNKACASRKQWERQLDIYAAQDGVDGEKNAEVVPKALEELKRAEQELDDAKKAAAETEELLLMRRQELRVAEAAQSGVDLDKIGTPVGMVELEDMIIRDKQGKIAEDGRHVLVLDPTRTASKFFMYADMQYLNVLYPRDMDAENLRYQTVRAIRYGSVLCFDLMDMDRWDKLSQAYDKVMKGLWMLIVKREILSNEKEKYLELLTDAEKEEEEFKPIQFQPAIMASFRCVLVANCRAPDDFLVSQLNTFRVVGV